MLLEKIKQRADGKHWPQASQRGIHKEGLGTIISAPFRQHLCQSVMERNCPFPGIARSASLDQPWRCKQFLVSQVSNSEGET